MNACERDLLLNVQQKYKLKLYNFEDCVALIDVGKLRRNQEDSLLVSEKFSNTLMLIADGMGGLEDGAFASRMAAIDTYEWFQSLQKSKFDNIDDLSEEYEKFVEELDIKIRNNCDGGTTLLIAIELENSILLFNIGDSRAYIYNDLCELSQVTRDQSITQELYENGVISCKGYMRFHKKNNLICSRLGCSKKLLTIETQLLPKEGVNDLFLFTDGVTDCISDNTLFDLIYNNNDEVISRQILEYVMTHNSYFNIPSDDYYDMIEAGKDNISIIHKKIRRK